MVTVQTYPWDAAEYLETKEDIAAYLEAALEDGDPKLVVAVLGDIARSRGITQIARDTGLETESLKQALSNGDNLDLVTVLKLVRAFGLNLQVVPIA